MTALSLAVPLQGRAVCCSGGLAAGSEHQDEDERNLSTVATSDSSSTLKPFSMKLLFSTLKQWLFVLGQGWFDSLLFFLNLYPPFLYLSLSLSLFLSLSVCIGGRLLPGDAGSLHHICNMFSHCTAVWNNLYLVCNGFVLRLLILLMIPPSPLVYSWLRLLLSVDMPDPWPVTPTLSGHLLLITPQFLCCEPVIALQIALTFIQCPQTEHSKSKERKQNAGFVHNSFKVQSQP